MGRIFDTLGSMVREVTQQGTNSTSNGRSSKSRPGGASAGNGAGSGEAGAGIADKLNAEALTARMNKYVQAVVDYGVLIIMMVLPGAVHDYRIAFGVALGAGILIMIFNYIRYRKGHLKVFPKLFEVGLLVINFGILMFEVGDNPRFGWSKLWTGIITSACLFTLAMFSIIIGKPFSIEFAMEKVPEEHWGTEMFYWVNLVISAVWGAHFVLSILFTLLAVYVYPNSEVGKVVPEILILVLTLKFTAEFPKFMKDRAERNRVSDEGRSYVELEANTNPGAPPVLTKAYAV